MRCLEDIRDLRRHRDGEYKQISLPHIERIVEFHDGWLFKVPPFRNPESIFHLGQPQLTPCLLNDITVPHVIPVSGSLEIRVEINYGFGCLFDVLTAQMSRTRQFDYTGQDRDEVLLDISRVCLERPLCDGRVKVAL